MSSRHRTASAVSAEWENLRAECDNSIHNLQDEDVAEYDHCRLYITNVPSFLTEEGLRQAFTKYGNLEEVYISSDPRKRFGLVRYETPGEAKLALTKLHQADPLKLNITVAKRGKTSAPVKSRNVTVTGTSSGYKTYKHENEGRKNRQSSDEDGVSVSSRPFKDRSDSLQDDLMLKEMDGDSPDEVQELKLQVIQLKRQEMELKLKQAIKKTKGKESLPSGRNVFRDSEREIRGAKIVVRNDRDRGTSIEKHDMDKSFGTGAGDSASQTCVSCDQRPGTLYCGRCEVTPYCSAQCQKRDWIRRHRSVCHNLARLSLDDIEDDEHDGAMPSLRQPHKLTGAITEEPANAKNDYVKRNDGFGQKDDEGRRNDGYGQKNDGFGRKDDGNEKKNDGFARRNDGYGSRNNEGRRNDGYGKNNNGYEKKNDGHGRRNDGYGVKNNEGRRNDGFGRNNDNSQRNDDGFGKRNDGFGDRKNNYDNRDGQKFDQRAKNHRASRSQDFNNRRQADRSQDNEEEWPAPPQSQETPKPEPKSPVVVPTAPQVNRNEQKPVSVAQEVAKVVEPKLKPEKCVIDMLSPGDTIMLSVLEKDTQVICLSLSPAFAEDYGKLCDEYVVYCEGNERGYVPTPGELFSYLDTTDGSWYRARCLDGDTAALIDAGRTLQYTTATTTHIGDYGDIVEYCCVIDGSGECNPGDCYNCTVLSRDGARITVSRMLGTTALSDAVLTRWMPPVKYPEVVSQTVSQADEQARPPPPQIPSVPRPPLCNRSVVTLVHISNEGGVQLTLREAHESAVQRDDMLEAEVAHYGLTASTLTTPPTKGDVVISKHTDGVCYRALVKRTNVKLNKYLVEYIEFGSEEKTTLERLYPCPADLHLSTRPCHANIATLHSVELTLSDHGMEYLKQLKDKDEVLVVSTPNNEKSLPSGSAVTLIVQSSGSNVNNRVAEMSKPDWKKVEEGGGDVFETKVLMLRDMTYLPLPPCGAVSILDSSAFDVGMLAVCPTVDYVEYVEKLLGPVTDRMADYCKSKIGSEPYLPRMNEMCIARFPPHDGWYRAALVDLNGGAGGDTVMLLYLDYGNIGQVGREHIRKMMSEYVDDLPAMASSTEIKDFPTSPTPEMLSKARKFLQIPEDGSPGGVLPYTSIEEIEPGNYRVTAPELLAALRE